jgi:translation initiation factor 1
VNKKKNRIDTTIDHIPLTSSPFAGLHDLHRIEHPPTVADVEKVDEDASGSERGQGQKAFSVARTRKGGWPVSVEKRPGNRQVTIIKQVSGDRQALLNLLKQRCGAGGAVRDETVEIQGDQRAAVESLLNEQTR